MADVSLNAEFKGDAAPLVAATKEVGSATNNMHRQISGAFADAGKQLELTDKTISGLGKSVSGFGASTASVISGMFGAMAVRQAASSYLQLADNVQNSADAFGVSAEQFQRFDIAGGQIGVKLEDITKFHARLVKQLESSDAPKDFTDAIAKIGLNIDQLRATNPDQLMGVIAGGMNRLSTANERIAVTNNIFGKGAEKIIPLLKDYSALMQDAADSGAVLTAQQIKEADAVGDLIAKYSKLALARGGSAVINNPYPIAVGATAGALIGGVAGAAAGPVGIAAGASIGASIGTVVGGALTYVGQNLEELIGKLNGTQTLLPAGAATEAIREKNNLRRIKEQQKKDAIDKQYDKDNAEYQKGVAMIEEAQQREDQRHTAGIESNPVDRRLSGMTPMDIVWMGGAETAKAILTEQERAWDEEAKRLAAEGKKEDEIAKLRDKQIEAQTKLTEAPQAQAVEEQKALDLARYEKAQTKAEGMLFKDGTQPAAGGNGKLATTKSILDKEREKERADRDQQRKDERFQRLYEGAVEKQEHGRHLGARERWALNQGAAVMGQVGNAPGLQIDNTAQEQLTELKQIREKIDKMSGRTWDGEG